MVRQHFQPTFHETKAALQLAAGQSPAGKASVALGDAQQSLAKLDPVRIAESLTQKHAARKTIAVKFDVSESDEGYEVTAELPGLDEKDVEVSISEGLVTIKGEKKAETEEKKKDTYISERSYGAFRRSFRLPQPISENKVEARFDKGVLRVTLPKAPEAKKKAKKIAIAKG